MILFKVHCYYLYFYPNILFKGSLQDDKMMVAI